MLKRTIYKYLGENGVLETPIHLPGIYSVVLTELVAEQNKILFNDELNQYKPIVVVPRSEERQWREIPLAEMH